MSNIYPVKVTILKGEEAERFNRLALIGFRTKPVPDYSGLHIAPKVESKTTGENKKE